MALKKFLMVGFVAASLTACGDNGSSVTNSDEDSSSSVCEDCDGSSSSKTKSSSSSAKSSSSVALSSSVPEGYVDPSTVVKGSMTDERDGQTYKTVKIGTQTWMAENLNYAYTDVPFNYDGYTSDSTSWCYGNNASNCDKYGRLYTWAAAVGKSESNCGYGQVCFPILIPFDGQGVCPKGWRLPSNEDWETLFTAVGGRLTAGKMLKSASGWKSGNGTDAYSFSALPAGYATGVLGIGTGLGNETFFWSSTEYPSLEAYRMELIDYKESARLYHDYKNYASSVRCFRNSQVE